jgi:hypothetical protein
MLFVWGCLNMGLHWFNCSSGQLCCTLAKHTMHVGMQTNQIFFGSLWRYGDKQLLSDSIIFAVASWLDSENNPMFTIIKLQSNKTSLASPDDLQLVCGTSQFPKGVTNGYRPTWLWMQLEPITARKGKLCVFILLKIYSPVCWKLFRLNQQTFLRQRQPSLFLLKTPLWRCSALASYLSPFIWDKWSWLVGLSCTGQKSFCMGAEPDLIRRAN